MNILLRKCSLPVSVALLVGLSLLSDAALAFGATPLGNYATSRPARQPGFSISISQQGASVAATWISNGASAYYVSLKDSAGAQVTGYWVTGLSTVVTLPHFGDFTLFVAPSGQSSATAFVSYIDYATTRVVEPYFPVNDTSKTTIAFSWDHKSQDYAYYLQIDQQAGPRTFAGWVYSSTFSVSLPVGAYVWKVTPVSVVGGTNVYGVASSPTFFNVRASIGGLEDLLGLNPLAASDPLRTPLTYPEDTLRLPDGSWLISDSYHSVIKRYAHSSVTVLAGTGVGGYNGDGAAGVTQLNHPTGLALAPDGTVVFCDAQNFLLRKLDLNTLAITTIWGVPGMPAVCDHAGNVSDRRLGYLKLIAYHGGALFASIQVLGQDGLYVSNLYTIDGNGAHPSTQTSPLGFYNIVGFDWYGSTLYLMVENRSRTAYSLVKFDRGNSYSVLTSLPNANGITVIGQDDVLIGGGSTLYEYGSQTLVARTSIYLNIVRVERVDSGNIAIVDSDAGQVVEEDLSTLTPRVVVRNGTNSFGVPVWIVQQDSSHILVLYNHPSYIFRFNTQTGETTLVAGNGKIDFATGGIDSRASALRYPNCMVLDYAGNIFVAEQGGINRIDAATNVISLYAGNPTSGGFIDNVPLLQAQFGSVNGLSFDANQNLLVSDGGNNRIRLISNGMVTTVAGNGSLLPIAYGQDAKSVGINNPKGAISYSGGLIIPQAYRNSISFVDASGLLNQMAGLDIDAAYQGQGSFVDGPRLSAEFNTPVSVTPLAQPWDFLVCDSFNNRIRRVNSNVSTVVGDGNSGYGPNSMNIPNCVATQGTAMYIADLGNGLLRSYSLPH